ncbi:Lrp/AsnC family transcriptional regulator [Pseudarthrobacter sp. NamE2]|uniref:Lrp/AsnC family transcriptional regulator n=1 Tax=Pseudarthrobacter sp. NamE2 TaxID=2576838 RepID=UPI0010FDF5B2|nr:Lrp/AsnC family transcriptional regulator [Pseudarthrobacter sp. NamE2]TLM82649.1 Lrp/AsnC family transcriptional regulator [Pseudarthrobacter sp. NamE2]
MLNMHPIDALDAEILLTLDQDPQATVLSLSRTLGVARNTVHARLKRLVSDGTLAPFSQRVRTEALGLPLTAFISISISQSSSDQAMAALLTIPEIIEMHATTGDADLLAKVAAKDPADLHRVTNAMLAIAGVVRTSTAMSLVEVMPARTVPLLEAVAGRR